MVNETCSYKWGIVEESNMYLVRVCWYVRVNY